jgi:hypothetical protein
MDNKTLIGIIIILLIGIGGAYYLKTNNTAENPPQIQNPEWNQWQNNENNSNENINPNPIIPEDQKKPNILPSPKSYEEALSLAKAVKTT